MAEEKLAKLEEYVIKITEAFAKSHALLDGQRRKKDGTIMKGFGTLFELSTFNKKLQHDLSMELGAYLSEVATLRQEFAVVGEHAVDRPQMVR